MSCPFCEAFACYHRLVTRRLETATFEMSEDNAQLLVQMGAQIRNVARTTLRLISYEAVPTLVCDLIDGIAEGIITELSAKLPALAADNHHASTARASPRVADGARTACQRTNGQGA